MNPLLRFLLNLFGITVNETDHSISRNMNDSDRENAYSSASNADSLFPNILERSHHVKRIIDVIGPMASSDGMLSNNSVIGCHDENGTPQEITHRIIRRCDCGSVIGYNNTTVGACRICSRIVCAMEGCSARCEKCGALVCARHSFRYHEHIFCSAHRLHALWLIFWGVLE